MYSNIPEYSVSELSTALKRVIENSFTYIKIRGEISGYRGPSQSGHIYFSLKDPSSKVDAIIWRSKVGAVNFQLQDGLEVIATGKLTNYGGSSKYQIIIDKIELAGEGALFALLEQRKRELELAGFFAQDKKLSLPFLPKSIGIITSPTGAVIEDIIHRIKDRCPVPMILCPVAVQGENCALEVREAIRIFNRLYETGHAACPEVLIIARGGGSIEDLWGFNDEELVKEAFYSKIPIISAIGHETDWCLLDLAASKRAPTPTAAAEMAVPVKTELLLKISSIHKRSDSAIYKILHNHQKDVKNLVRAIPDKDSLLANFNWKLDDLDSKFSNYISNYYRNKMHNYALLTNKTAVSLLQNMIEIKDSQLINLADKLRIVYKADFNNKIRHYNAIASRCSSMLLEKNFTLATYSLEQGYKALGEVISKKILYKANSLDSGRVAMQHVFMQLFIKEQSARFKQLHKQLHPNLLQHKLVSNLKAFSRLDTRLTNAIKLKLSNCATQLEVDSRLLQSFSYRNILQRGFALVRDEQGKPLLSAADSKEKEIVKIQFVDGVVVGRIIA